MSLDRRSFLLGAPLAIGAVGVAAAPAAARSHRFAQANAYLKDLALMLRSAVPIENAVVALGRKYAGHADLAPLSLDLARLLRRRDAASDDLARVFAAHRHCFSQAVAERIQRCVRSGNLDRVA
jgi:hypothetical protein